MAKIVFPTSPLFRADPDTPITARLRDAVVVIEAMTVDDAALYPERSDHDWPRLDRLGLDAPQAAAVRSAWWSIITAVERRVEAIDPDSGGYDVAYCWPVYRVYGGHWLAVVEAAGLNVIEPILPVSDRARCQPQLGLWPRHAGRVGS